MAIYKEDLVDYELSTGNIHRSFLKHSIGAKDQKADWFGVRVFRDGEPVELTGVTVQGYFRDPMGNNIAITSGNYVSGNIAEVCLPQACYNYEGQFVLAIKLVSATEGVTGTVRIVDGVVDNTNTGGAVAPTGAVPSYQEVLATYELMTEALEEFQGYKDGIDNAIEGIETQLDAVIEGGTLKLKTVPTVYDGAGIDGINGNTASTTAYNYTDYISIPAGCAKVSLHASFSANLGMAFYDSSKTYISGVSGTNASDYGGTDTSVPQTLELNIPANAAYIRACYRTAYYTKPEDYDVVFQSQKDSVYKLIDDVAETAEENLEAAEGTLEAEIKNIADIVTGKNLYKPTNTTAGAIQQDGSISTSGAFAAYITSDYLAVEPSTNYVISAYSSTSGNLSDGRKLYLLFDENKVPIQGTYINNTGESFTINNANAHFVRISISDEVVGQLENGSSRTAYEAYHSAFELNSELGLTETMTEQLGEMSFFDILYGKKWIPIGDSFTDYTNKTFESGSFATKYKSYPRLIAERTGVIISELFMLSGRTMAYPADGTFNNSLTCPTEDWYFQNIPEDADYITIMLGINDSQHVGSGSTEDGEDATGVITLGEITDTTTATYYGAYNTVLEWLHTNRPFAHVGIIVTNGTTREDYTEAQIALAKKWGYPYINLNGDERTPAMIRCYNPNLSNELKELIKQKQAVDYDGTETGSVNTHPNWQTHEMESYIIEAWLKSL